MCNVMSPAPLHLAMLSVAAARLRELDSQRLRIAESTRPPGQLSSRGNYLRPEGDHTHLSAVGFDTEHSGRLPASYALIRSPILNKFLIRSTSRWQNGAE